jgi:hypothetical protein
MMNHQPQRSAAAARLVSESSSSSSSSSDEEGEGEGDDSSEGGKKRERRRVAMDGNAASPMDQTARADRTFMDLETRRHEQTVEGDGGSGPPEEDQDETVLPKSRANTPVQDRRKSVSIIVVVVAVLSRDR